MPSPGRSAASLAAILLLIAACGSPTPDTTQSQPTTVAPRAAEPSAQVLAALSDGVVTSQELEAAYRNQVQCLETGGAFGSYAFDLDIGPSMALNVGVEGDGREGQLTESLMFFCEQRHVGDLAGIYGGANPVTEEQRRRGAAAMQDCLREAGLEAEGSVTELRSVIDRLFTDAAVDRETRTAASECYTAGDTGPWRDLGG